MAKVEARIPLGERESQKLEFKSSAILEQPDKIAKEVVAMLNAEGGEVWIGIREDEARAVECEPIRNAESAADRHTRTDSGESQRAKAEAEKYLIEQREKAVADNYAGLWLCVAPFPPVSIDLESPLLDDLATVPSLSGNRRAGRNFSQSPTRPELSSNSVQWGWAYPYETGGQKDHLVEAEIDGEGRAKFFVGYQALMERGTIWPQALLEYPISAFRILSQLYAGLTDTPVSFELAADLALLHVGSRELWPMIPEPPGTVKDEDRMNLNRVLTFTRQEVLDEPDRCGFRLLKFIYRGFGFRENAIPREFDRDAGRLVIPE
jgi:hypothetical protein